MSTPRTLSHEEARRVYDRIGARQDTQGFYENRPTDLLVTHGRFGSARRVFEFGCGTGRFAARLLAEALPDGAFYHGMDLSPTMVGLAQERIAPFGARARITLSEGGPPADEPTGSCDRFVSSYVLDLLSEAEIGAVLREAHRMLEPGGLLCLTGLTSGFDFASRTLIGVWSRLHRLSPRLVGGCRPIELTTHLPATDWTVLHRETVAPFAVPSEVIVAERS